MRNRMLILLLVPLLLAPVSEAKKKKNQVLPDYVLKAQTVLVVIHPDAGEPAANPTANRTAQENVEKAIMKWGRFKLVMDAQTCDLIIAIRKGLAAGPTVRNSPADDRTIIYQPSGSDVRVGGQVGRPPDLSNPGPGPINRRPQVSNEIGPAEDTFEVYRGGIESPLDASPVWRYMAKNALNEPQVSAVEEFRRTINESEQPHKP